MTRQVVLEEMREAMRFQVPAVMSVQPPPPSVTYSTEKAAVLIGISMMERWVRALEDDL